jgi:hypothetical protein
MFTKLKLKLQELNTNLLKFIQFLYEDTTSALGSIFWWW